MRPGLHHPHPQAPLRLILLLVLCLPGLFSLPCRGDLVKLKSGRWIEGAVLHETPRSVTLQTARDKRTFHRENILELRKGRTIYDLFLEKGKAVERDDTSGMVALAAWVRSHGYNRLAREYLLSRLKTDPKNRGLREALGHRFQDGAWFTTEEDLLRHRKFVRVSGVWLSPQSFEGCKSDLAQVDGEWFSFEDALRLAEGRAVPFPAEKGFSVFRTRGTLVRVAESVAKPESYARLAEQAQARFQTYFGFPSRGICDVRILPSREAFIEYLATHREPGMPFGALPHGFFNPSSDSVILGYFHSQRLTRIILLHELCHRFEWAQSPQSTLPLWYREGVACYLSQYGFTRGSLTLGRLNPGGNLHHVHLGRLFQKKQAWTLRRTLSPGAEEFASPYFYDHAWSLVYFLRHGAEPALRKAFRAYEKGLHSAAAKKEDLSRFLPRQLGLTLDDLEARWRAYWREHFAGLRK